MRDFISKEYLAFFEDFLESWEPDLFFKKY